MNGLDRGGYRTPATRDAQAYTAELLLALRMRGVSGPRIAETLAEVSSHLSETGEDPVEAFGPAKTYADEVVAALGEPVTSASPRPRRTAHDWTRDAGAGNGGEAGRGSTLVGWVASWPSSSQSWCCRSHWCGRSSGT